MTHDAMREVLEAERAELIAKNEAATSWGAAVGARHERIKEIDRELSALSTPSDAGNASAEARLREALDVARRALVVLRVRLSAEPAVQGRSWIDLGIMLNNAVDKADKALSAGGDEAKKS